MAVVVQEHLKISLATLISFLLGFLVGQETNLGLQLLWAALGLPAVYIVPALLRATQIVAPFRKCDRDVFALTLTTYCFGIIDALSLRHISLFSCYLIIVTIYHYGQFQLVNTYHNQELAWYSFLIYHSKSYTTANIAAFAQHAFWTYAVGAHWKNDNPLAIPAFLVMFTGLTIRLLAFYTAKSNFTHEVQHDKAEKHRLVTHGIYSLVRHPGYMGFFYYSVGSMVFIGNPICVVAYALVLRRFFHDRIQYSYDCCRVEQFYLKEFFPEYEAYRAKTPVLIPFV